MPDDLTLATRLLSRMDGGDDRAADELLDLLHAELHRLAKGYMSGERRDHTLQPTALVNEAWVRLVNIDTPPEWESRAHFLRVAARAMRNVLIDHARARGSRKRDAPGERVPLDDVLAPYENRALDVIALDAAIEKMQAMDDQLAKIVELRFFAGLTIEETAKVLGVSTPTVERGWRVARMWLRKEIPSAEGDTA